MNASPDRAPPPQQKPPEPSKPAEDHIHLLHQTLNALSQTPPRIIVSPATQPRRASVALIIQLVPASPLKPNPQYVPPKSLDELFSQEWAKQQGCTAELMYIRRRPLVDSRSAENGEIPAVSLSQQQQHVAFPGGRWEQGDENPRYTAMRATWSEFGIDLAENEWLYVGQMDDRELTSSLGKRLLMVLSSFVFIRTSPYPIAPVPPVDPNDDPNVSLRTTMFSVPIPYLTSTNSSWSHVDIDISSRIAPTQMPSGGFLSRIFGRGGPKKQRRKRSESSATDTVLKPAEGSVEEAALMASQNSASFWLWILRSGFQFFIRSMVGDMRFPAMLLKGRVVPYGDEDPSLNPPPPKDEPRLWGVTLGMTLDLLTGMQPHLYEPDGPPYSYHGNILEYESRSSVQLAGYANSKSSPNLTFAPLSETGSSSTKRRGGARSRAASGSGVGSFSGPNGEWVPSRPGTAIPEHPSGWYKLPPPDLEGANVWTPSMTSVFPRFSVPDVNIWIWVFGRKYRRVVQGWEQSLKFGGGSYDKRVNWSGLALSTYYAAVRKALVLVIVARIVGILVALGVWTWWMLRRKW